MDHKTICKFKRRFNYIVLLIAILYCHRLWRLSIQKHDIQFHLIAAYVNVTNIANKIKIELVLLVFPTPTYQMSDLIQHASLTLCRCTHAFAALRRRHPHFHYPRKNNFMASASPRIPFTALRFLPEPWENPVPFNSINKFFELSPFRAVDLPLPE